MKKNMTKTILLSAILAGIAGCAYAPDDDMSEYPVDESSEYALAPNARWTSLHYYTDWTPVSAGSWGMWIHLDSHLIQFVEFDDEQEMVRQRISNHKVTADNWNWIAEKLKEADVSRWKTSYWPGEGWVVDGTFWTLEFLNGSTVVGKVRGENAWPKNFKAFLDIAHAFR